MRIFTHVAQTSTAIQVAWSHPANFQKVIKTQNEDGTVIMQKQHIQYILEYGIGVKFNGKEQFRQIYKGKAHKCIITDLMPRTTFRLRVAPVLHIEMALHADDNLQEPAADKKTVTQIETGEWSEVTNIATKDIQTLELAATTPGILPFAQLHQKSRKKWVSFDKIGTLHASYGYSFGEHLWIIKI